MPFGAALIAGGGALLGGYFQGEAIKDASDASVQGSRYAADLEQGRYEQSREDLAPWRQAGERALGGMQDLMYGDPQEQMESLRSTPGYQFRLDEGLKALTRSSLAGSVSGNTHRALMERGQEYASDEFGQQYNRLASMAGLGQASTHYGAQLGAQSAGRQGGYLTSAADTRGAAGIGRANVYADTLGSLASAGSQAYGAYNAPGGTPFTGNFAGSPSTSQNYSSDYRPPGGSFLNTPGYQ